MESNTTFSDADEGKTVVNQSGQTIGRVVEVTGHSAHVDPDPGVTDTIKSKLGWGDSDEDTYQLESDLIERVSDSEVHLNR